jgi:hypothetical protein
MFLKPVYVFKNILRNNPIIKKFEKAFLLKEPNGEYFLKEKSDCTLPYFPSLFVVCTIFSEICQFGSFDP